jgi:hypothetical protein
MEKLSSFSIFKTILITGLLFVSGCDKTTTEETGFLEGNINIGPICPVETDPPLANCLPTAETYNAYPVGVATSDGSRRIALISPASDGSFRLELPPGNYLVLLEKEHNNIGSSNLPVQITIVSQGKTILNIDIDTGIR